MEKEEINSPLFKPRQTSTDPLTVPKTFNIPRYSEKFKEIIANAAVSPKIKALSPPKKQESKKDFFFYRVKTIGVGAHSFVYLVQEDNCKMLLAQKAVTLQHAREIKQDLIRQIKLLSWFQHDNLIKLYHLYATDTHLNLVMEFAQDSLFALKQKFKIFKEKQVLEVVRQLLRALRHLHSHNIVHADVKLENIMIANGTIKLCDFGLAHKSQTSTHNNTSQNVVGTLQYLPPQYAKGTDSGAMRDIWAVGILAFEMSTGKHPFQDMKQNEKWSKLVSNPPCSLTIEFETERSKLGGGFEKVKQLIRNIFVEWQKRQTAEQLLKHSLWNTEQ